MTNKLIDEATVKLVLEALENSPMSRKNKDGIDALREALAKDVPETNFGNMAKQPAQLMHPEIKKMYEDYFDKCFKESSPAQREPVAWLHPANATCVTTDPSAYARGIPLYTTPQPALCAPAADGVCESLDCPNHKPAQQTACTWVDVTLADREKLRDRYGWGYPSLLVDAISDILKEKNT